MVEEVPLALVLHETVVVGPAAVGMFCHDDAIEVPGTEGRLGHGVGQRLSGVLAVAGIAAYPGERQVVPIAATEDVGTFLETVGQTFHLLAGHLHGRHFGHAVASGHLHFLQLAVNLQHVVLQLGAADAHATPIDVGLAVVVNQDGGVDARHALDGFLFQREGTLRTGSRSHADGKSTA